MRVTLNIYDVQRNCNQKGGDMFGLGIYHTGVFINGSEYHYGGNTASRASGVYVTPPTANPNFMFKCSIELGPIPPKALRANEAKLKGRPNDQSAFDDSRLVFGRDIQPILYELQDEFRAYKYHLLLNNCNHFADAFVRRLYGGQQSLPGWVNRIAFIGSFFHCVVPFNLVTVGTPEGQEQETRARIAEWRKEDDAKYANKPSTGSSWWGSSDTSSSAPRGRTLSQLSSRETEADTSRDSIKSGETSGSYFGGYLSSFYSSLMVRPEQPEADKEIKSNNMDTTMNDDDDEDEMIGSQYRSEMNASTRLETELAASSPRANTERIGNDTDDEFEEEHSPLKSRGDSRTMTQPTKRSKPMDPSVLRKAAAARMARQAAKSGQHTALTQNDDMEAEGGEPGSSMLSYFNPMNYFGRGSSSSNDKLQNADKNSDEGAPN